jgi:hypothetical protein
MSGNRGAACELLPIFGELRTRRTHNNQRARAQLIRRRPALLRGPGRYRVVAGEGSGWAEPVGRNFRRSDMPVQELSRPLTAASHTGIADNHVSPIGSDIRKVRWGSAQCEFWSWAPDSAAWN